MTSEYFRNGIGMPSEAENFDELAMLCSGKQRIIEILLAQVHDGIPFEQWEKDVKEYLKTYEEMQKRDLSFVIGGEQDMLYGYYRGLKSFEYVEQNLEDGSR